jgi:hypothetical protein
LTVRKVDAYVNFAPSRASHRPGAHGYTSYRYFLV